MATSSSRQRLAAWIGSAALAGLLAAAPARAQNQGFQVNRYEPTPAGEWSLAVDHPAYSPTATFAAGLSFNYAHNPLVFGYRSLDGTFSQAGAVLAHQLIAHVDLAASFRGRVVVALSLPVTLLEQGTAQYGLAPATSPAVGDPRVGARVRLYGQPEQSAFSVSLGVDLWVPLNALPSSPPFPAQTGESSVRVLPRLILGGLQRRVLWSLTAGFYWRPDQLIGTLPDGSGNGMGAEVQLGLAAAYARPELGLAVGPEAVLSTIVTGGHAFTGGYTSIELLLGAHYHVKRRVALGLGVGTGLLREAGTPDARLLLRLAYAPRPAAPAAPRDRDGDGIADRDDACPDEAGSPAADPRRNGCRVPADQDGDGIPDEQDPCPRQPAGPRPDPALPGCPLRDADGDGTRDVDDACPRVPAGAHPDPAQPGCPLADEDGDGIYPPEDQCPREPAGASPDPRRPGCPDRDTDGDGVLDGADQCPQQPAALLPDPARPGCPLADRDGDQVPDRVDACPDQPGAPAADARKNGCPGLVEVRAGAIAIRKPVFFAANKDTILKTSYPVLDAVVAALSALPQIKKLAIEGHTDGKGKPERNTELSRRRADSVRRYLVSRGIADGRLTAAGYGPSRPVADNKTAKGRAKNRRVDFVIVDPPAKPPGG
jgi:outer membrane protein OmpA-like peptidoglycan-associated protein